MTESFCEKASPKTIKCQHKKIRHFSGKGLTYVFCLDCDKLMETLQGHIPTPKKDVVDGKK